MGDWLLGIAGIAIIIVVIISPVIAFFLSLTGRMFREVWTVSNMVLLGILFLLVTPILLLSYYTEDKPLIDKMDQQYEEVKNELPQGNTTKKIFVEIYQTGVFGLTRKNSNPLVNFIINNYNDQDFKGKIMIRAVYKGEKIGEKEVEIELLANTKGYIDYVRAPDLQINKEIWKNVEFEYSISGNFVETL